MSFVPIFKDNIETQSILSNDAPIKLLSEIPNTAKTWVNQAATSFTSSGGNFQVTNLNSWVICEYENIWNLQYKFQGLTVAPRLSINNGTDDLFTNTISTSALLFDPRFHTVDAMAINKTLTEIKYNIGSKAWTETDRTHPEMIDIFALQFSTDLLKAYNIYKDGSPASGCIHLQPTVCGGTIFPLGQLAGADLPLQVGLESKFGFNLSNNADFYLGAGKIDYVNDWSIGSQPQQQNKGFYVDISSTFTFKSNGIDIPYTSAQIARDVEGYEGVDCPFAVDTSTNTRQAVYSIPVNNGGSPWTQATLQSTLSGDNYLTQTVKIQVREYTISPYCSNPYTKNPHKKVLFTNAAPLNITYLFNKDYLRNSFIKWCPTFAVPNDTLTLFGYTSTTSGTIDVDLTNSKLRWVKLNEDPIVDKDNQYVRLWTFNSAKPLPDQPVKMVYYRQNRQTPQIQSMSIGASKSTSTVKMNVSTGQLPSLDRFVIIYGAVKKELNPQYSGSDLIEVLKYPSALNLAAREGNKYSTHAFPQYEFCDIDKIDLRVGTQGDAFGGIEDQKEKLADMTLDALRNPQFKNLLLGNEKVLTQLTLSLINTLNCEHFGQANQNYETLLQQYKKVGMPFVIIDMAKLNLRTVEGGLPLIPQINYGNTAYKAGTINTNFSASEQMFEFCKRASISSLQVEYNVIFMEQRMKIFPLFVGAVQDEQIEWNFENVSADVIARINDGFSDWGEDNLAYIGGAFAPMQFLSNLYDKGKDLYSKAKPYVQQGLSGVDMVKDLIKDKDSLATLHAALSALSSVGKSVFPASGRYQNV